MSMKLSSIPDHFDFYLFITCLRVYIRVSTTPGNSVKSVEIRELCFVMKHQRQLREFDNFY